MRIFAYCGEGLGNNVLFTPALQAMQRMYPHVKIDILSKFPDIYRGMPDVFASSDARFLRSHYDIAFSNIFDHPEHYMNTTIIEKLPAPKYSVVKHEALCNMQPLLDFGYKGGTPQQYVPVIDDMPNIRPTDGRPVVGICDGSKPRSDCRSDHEFIVWSKKKWPHWSPFVEMLFEEEIAVAIFGTPEDGPDDLPFSDHLYDFRGNFKVDELAGALRQMDAFVTNDCGPMHVADAAGVNTFALFGPTSIEKNGPMATNSTIIDAQDLTGKEEPVQGTREFATITESPSLLALSEDKVREIIGPIGGTLNILGKE